MIYFNVYKLGAFQYPMRAILFIQIINTGICSISVQMSVVNTTSGARWGQVLMYSTVLMSYEQ